MWFRPEQIQTASLKRVIRYNQNKLEVEMAQLLLTILDLKENVLEISFTLSDMQDWLMKKGFRGYETGSIRRVLQNVWHLKPSDNSFAYLQYRFGTDGAIYEYNQKGRFYLVTKKEILIANNIDDFDDNDINN